MDDTIQVYNLRAAKTLTVASDPNMILLRITVRDTEIHFGMTLAEMKGLVRQLEADIALLSNPLRRQMN